MIECTIENQEVGGQENINKAILKGQQNTETTPKEYWILYFDEALKTKSSVVDLVLQSHEGFTVEYALKLVFPTKNNEAKYEALIAGL